MIMCQEPVRVLHMEDDAGIARLVEKRLRRDGYVVHNASNGKAGLAMHLAQKYDLIIADQRMPGCDGIEVIRHLASRGCLPATIMVTGAGDEKVAVEAMKLGADDYIVKDVGDGYLDLLPTIIQRALRQRRLAEEKRHAEQSLRESEERSRRILMSVQVGIVLIDPKNHTVLEANPTALRTLGVSGEALIGSSCHEFICTASPDTCPFSNVREIVFNLEDEILTSDGCRVPVLRTVVPFMLEGRTHLLESFIDVSKLRNLERQLRQAQKLEAIGHLAAGIAHEINTPAQYVEGNVQFLREAFESLISVVQQQQQALAAADGVPEELMAAFSQMGEECDLTYLLQEVPKAITDSLEGLERVSSIICAMKEFSHPGTEEKTPMDINKAIQSTITIALNEWKYVADVVTDFDPRLPLVSCLPGDLNQVFLNLLVNAAHTIKETLVNGASGKGTISITTRLENEEAQILVTDTGTGIPANIRSRVFDPFFTTKSVGEGSGQGLAIAHDIIVNKHGGSISFDSRTGSGTTFIIEIPLNASASKKTEAAA